MKIVNEQAAKPSEAPIGKLQDAGKGKVWLWEKQTGKPKAFYSVDATELLEKYSDRWSASEVTKNQLVAEDAVIVDDSAKSEPVVPANEPESVAALSDEPDTSAMAWPTKDEANSKRSRSRRKSTTDNE